MSHVIVEVSFVPLGVGTSLSAYVAEALSLIRASGLPCEFHSMGTNIEGEWTATTFLAIPWTECFPSAFLADFVSLGTCRPTP
jgi:uncharacterized protein YqgV (UPF0045/DUF77 family)